MAGLVENELSRGCEHAAIASGPAAPGRILTGVMPSRRPRGTRAARLLVLSLFGLALLVGLCHTFVPRTARPPVADAARSAARPTDAPKQLAPVLHTVAIGGAQRTYRSYVPTTVTGRLPLVMVLHGRNQSWTTAVEQTGFLGLARRGQAILVYPDGIGRSWNAGSGCCGVAATKGLPDVAFVGAVLSDAQRVLPVDPARLYLVGYSNGGKLGYSLACQHPTMFAAMATYGSVPLAACRPGTAPTPYLLAAGQQDIVLPFNGAARAHPPLSPVRTAVGWLRTQDGCTGAVATATMGHAVVQRWTTCRAGSEVQSVVYSDVGHTWPTVSKNGSPSVSNLIWVFLAEHRLRTLPLSQVRAATEPTP